MTEDGKTERIPDLQEALKKAGEKGPKSPDTPKANRKDPDTPLQK